MYHCIYFFTSVLHLFVHTCILTHTYSHTHTHTHTYTHTCIHTHTHAHAHIHTALALVLSPLLFSYFRQPLGFILALLMAILGLFIPMTFHRLPHDEGWQNPTPMAGLTFGVMATTLCYFCVVFPNIFKLNSGSTYIHIKRNGWQFQV